MQYKFLSSSVITIIVIIAVPQFCSNVLHYSPCLQVVQEKEFTGFVLMDFSETQYRLIFRSVLKKVFFLNANLQTGIVIVF